MFQHFFRPRIVGVKKLIQVFKGKLSESEINDLLSYADNSGPGLAMEMLCELIYEHDIAVPEKVKISLGRQAARCGVDKKHLSFIRMDPPYPDLRTPDQKRDYVTLHQQLSNPSMETVLSLVKEGRKILAINMYRQVTGVGLEEAVRAVEEMA